MTLYCKVDNKTHIIYVPCGQKIVKLINFKADIIELSCNASKPHGNSYVFSALENDEKIFIHGILEKSRSKYFACNNLKKNKDKHKCDSDKQKIQCLNNAFEAFRINNNFNG